MIVLVTNFNAFSSVASVQLTPLSLMASSYVHISLLLQRFTLIKFKIKGAASTHNSTRGVDDSNNRIDDHTDLAIEEVHEQARNPKRCSESGNSAHEKARSLD